MKPEHESQIDEIFAAHAREADARKAAKDERKSRENALLVEFSAFINSTVKPVFDDVALRAKRFGVSAWVTPELKNLESMAEVTTGIKITLYPKDSDRNQPSYAYPYLSVCYRSSNKPVMFHQSTLTPGRGGQTGSVGEFEITEVTADLIHEKLASLLKAVMV